MSNAYVLGGYLAVVAIFGVYIWHLRRRARVLARNLPAPLASSRPSSGPSRPDSGSERERRTGS